MAGYSRTPLWKKLGLRDGLRGAVFGAPQNYAALIAPAPDVAWEDLSQGTEFYHVFAAQAATLQAELVRALPLIARDGMIWASWPKRSSKLPTDITEDTIRSLCLPMGLVDVKVCAVDARWSGLKLVIRKDLR